MGCAEVSERAAWGVCFKPRNGFRPSGCAVRQCSSSFPLLPTGRPVCRWSVSVNPAPCFFLGKHGFQSPIPNHALSPPSVGSASSGCGQQAAVSSFMPASPAHSVQQPGRMGRSHSMMGEGCFRFYFLNTFPCYPYLSASSLFHRKSISFGPPCCAWWGCSPFAPIVFSMCFGGGQSVVSPASVQAFRHISPAIIRSCFSSVLVGHPLWPCRAAHHPSRVGFFVAGLFFLSGSVFAFCSEGAVPSSFRRVIPLHCSGCSFRIRAFFSTLISLHYIFIF